MRSLREALGKTIANGQTACIVTVARVRGSAPREAGARMLVTATNSIGTIGGGQLEYQCIKLASDRIHEAAANDQPNELRTFPLGSNCGQCCGGVVDILFENVAAADIAWLGELNRLHDLQQAFVAVTSGGHGRALITADSAMAYGLVDSPLQSAITGAREMLEGSESYRWDSLSSESFFFERIAPSYFVIAVFGAGHVGSAVVATLATLDCRIRWIDSRKNCLPARAPDNVLMIESATPAQEVAAMPPASSFLIMTHSHALDFDICDQVLRRQDAAYCGLIGSLSKRRRFERLMHKQGMATDDLANLTCPIGIADIPGKRPQEIAIALAAELLQIRGRALGLSAPAAAENVHAL